MKKIAFFVEGQTEQIFVTNLLMKIIGKKNLTLVLKSIVGGTNVPKREVVKRMSISRNPEYLALVYDCGSDNRVKSAILENMLSLKESDYSKIVGVRDLYPLALDELPQLVRGLNFLPKDLKKLSDYYKMIVAVREVETWFLAETKHYLRVDKRLTGEFIRKRLNFNPYTADPIYREHPSKDLNDIYRLVGRSYTKKRWQVERLVNRLDYNNMQQHVRHEISSLNELFGVIEEFAQR